MSIESSSLELHRACLDAAKAFEEADARTFGKDAISVIDGIRWVTLKSQKDFLGIHISDLMLRQNLELRMEISLAEYEITNTPESLRDWMKIAQIFINSNFGSNRENLGNPRRNTSDKNPQYQNESLIKNEESRLMGRSMVST